MARALKLGGECLKGHPLSSENIVWNVSRGSRYPVCWECKRQKDREVRQRTGRTGGAYKPRPPRPQYPPLDKAARYHRAQLSRKRASMEARENELGELLAQGVPRHKISKALIAQLEALAPVGRARAALDDLNAAMAEQRTPCFDAPAAYQDYEEGSEPDAETARLLCSGCPVLELCYRYGELSGDHGVWGGRVWA